jgi:hypothetical protein
MKKLRNISIYYIVLGILLFCSILFSKLWKLSIIGIILFFLYLILYFIFKVKTFQVHWSKNKMSLWNLFFYLHPIFLVVFILWYSDRPFNQTVILPKNYEGVVVIDYDISDGQEENWTGAFLGMGGSRLIKTDKNGYAKTQFKYPDNSIPILDISSGYLNVEDMKIYYENNLNNEIPKYYGNDELYTDDLYKKHKNNNLVVAQTTVENGDRGGIRFVVCKDKDYYNYFYTEKETQEIDRKGEGYYGPDWRNKLRKEYSKLKR